MYGITPHGLLRSHLNKEVEGFIDLTAYGIPQFFKRREDAAYVRDIIEEEIQHNLKTRGWKPELLHEKQEERLRTLFSNS